MSWTTAYVFRSVNNTIIKSCSVASYSLWSHGLYSPWNSLGQNTGVGSLSLLQGIFPTQESNLDVPHCRQIPYQLSHKGSPRILEWVAYPLLQQIFLTQELNWGLLHCGQILYQLSPQESPREVEQVRQKKTNIYYRTYIWNPKNVTNQFAYKT